MITCGAKGAPLEARKKVEMSALKLQLGCALVYSWQHPATPRAQQERPWPAPAPVQRREGGPWRRRQALLAGLAGSAVLLGLHVPQADAALQLRSVASLEPCLVTFCNEYGRMVKVYWMNYTGDAEFFAAIPPSGWWSVETFESHPWRVVDAETEEVLREVVASRGISFVSVGPLAETGRVPPASDALGLEFQGWDGIGGSESEYAPAAIAEIGLDHLGGVALIAAEGFGRPVPIAVGMSDAAQLFHTAGPEFRRPSTMSLWVRSLQAAGATVDRVLITRLVGTTVYGRIILSVPGGELRSLDARPADSLALAMQTGAPLYIGRCLAASQQPGVPELEVGDWNELRPPTPSQQGSPPVPVQANYGHARKA